MPAKSTIVRSFIYLLCIGFFSFLLFYRGFHQVSQAPSYKGRDYPVLSFEEPNITEKNIFFIESSCAVKTTPLPEESWLRLSARAACAVEAAARQNPTRPVYVVHTCPLLRERVWADSPAPALQPLSLPNVHVWHVSARELLEGSPLDAVFRGAFQRSKWPVEHASDLMRLVLLWRYGGTYLDMDVYSVRTLGDMKNFVCVEMSISVSNAVLDFALDKPGRSALNACITEMQKTYSPDMYAINGPMLLSRTLRMYCGKKELKFDLEKEEDCHGLRLLPSRYFYPVLLSQWPRLLEEKDAEETMGWIRKSIAAHVWNKRLKEHPDKDVVDLRSNVPFAQMMRMVCPSVVAVSRNGI